MAAQGLELVGPPEMTPMIAVTIVTAFTLPPSPHDRSFAPSCCPTSVHTSALALCTFFVWGAWNSSSHPVPSPGKRTPEAMKVWRNE